MNGQPQQIQIPNLNITMDINAIDLIIRGLGKLPADESGVLMVNLMHARDEHIRNFQRQLQQQQVEPQPMSIVSNAADADINPIPPEEMTAPPEEEAAPAAEAVPTPNPTPAPVRKIGARAKK